MAGGKGVRMGGPLPKQFMLLKGKPVIYYSIKAFLDAFDDVEIILVLPEAYLQTGKEIVNGYFPEEKIELVTGGETRFHSVKNGLAKLSDESIVFVHDGVRCLISTDLIKRCYEAALKEGAAVPVVPVKDSVRQITDSGNERLDRSKLFLVQTPQTFQSKILIPAFQSAYQEKFTDEATVVEQNGSKVFLLEGEEENIKITQPLDLSLASIILESRV